MSKTLTKKTLYDYQQDCIDKIFSVLHEKPTQYNLLFQLPTGGGKTVIFSEIARKYLEEQHKKVLILTHRIELCEQTSTMLKEFDVPNKIINSNVKELEEGEDHTCFVAMVETLNNRLNDESMDIHNDIGLVIIDEAHYNSFNKLFKFFEDSFILGVTATPLSSNIKIPMKNNYKQLIIGEDIDNLIEKGVLAKAKTFTYNMNLSALHVGMNGDYTVKSSDYLYSQFYMQEKLIHAYTQQSLGKKTLIFNNGIKTSKLVYHSFLEAGYDVRHLDNTNSKQERQEILEWFKNKPDAILTSVSILTTGFDEPTVDTIILNRATKSLTLYYQMIGRGSRVTPTKKEFKIIDLGNNMARFGLWGTPIQWQQIFKNPNWYWNTLQTDEQIERDFRYEMPPDVRKQFSKTEDITFDVKAEFEQVTRNNLKSMEVLNTSIEQHANMCIDNAEDMYDAIDLVNLLKDDIKDRIKQYSFHISKSTNNYLEWLETEYLQKLRSSIRKNYN